MFKLSSCNQVRSKEVALPPEVGVAVKSLWSDRGVQECFRRSREYPTQRFR